MDVVHFEDSDVEAVPRTLAHTEAESAAACSDACSDDTGLGASRGGQAADVDSEDEDFFARGTDHIRKDKGRAIGRKLTAGRATNKKNAGRRVGHLSHLPTASAQDDNGYLSGSTITPPATELSRDRSESPLFEPEDEELIRPHNNVHTSSYMDGLKRARTIKGEIENNISVLQPQEKKTSSRRHVETDPENQLIKTLRQDQHMNWNEIAHLLNQERRNRGEAANFTDAAVYSRFVRNAPRIAVAAGEIGFDPKDYMHLRHPNQYTHADGSGTISKAGKKRVKNYDNATELKANVRKQMRLDEHSDLQTAEKTEQLMEAVAKVERNFWILVADEMERMTTKMYQPNELASRYHAI